MAGGPDYGALGINFKCVRIMQALCLISVIGMTANFISMMVSSSETPPNVLIGTLSVTCIAVIYCVITGILFLDNILPFLICTAVDSLLLIALVVVAVTVGKPLSYVNCQAIGTANDMSSAYDFTMSLGDNINQSGGQLDYTTWVGTTAPTCLEMKSIWGLSIALCVLFAFSSISGACLWRRKAALTPKGKDIEG
ncbi:hypothetical protein MMC19_007527 [Ptychographa xylographoides]|nr:hypothetical protein [Ptychographa xylographoides]